MKLRSVLHIRSIALLLIGIVLTSLIPTANAVEKKKEEKKKKTEIFTAVAFAQSGSMGAQPVHMTFYIERYSDDAEIGNLINALSSKGQDGLLDSVEKLKDKGRMAPMRGVGTGVQVIRQRPLKDGGRRITFVTDRAITFAEHRRMGRSRDYPFVIASFDLNAKGEGQGSLLLATKVTFTKDKQIELEHYGTSPMRLSSVRKAD
jgi:hypothetical protein